MSRRKKGRKTNILLGIICILLVGVLGSILVISRQAEQKESQRLTELADGQQSGIEDYNCKLNNKHRCCSRFDYEGFVL